MGSHKGGAHCRIGGGGGGSLLAFFFFFKKKKKMEISSCTLISLFMLGSVHSGSASWDDCGQMFRVACELVSEYVPTLCSLQNYPVGNYLGMNHACARTDHNVLIGWSDDESNLALLLTYRGIWKFILHLRVYGCLIRFAHKVRLETKNSIHFYVKTKTKITTGRASYSWMI